MNGLRDLLGGILSKFGKKDVNEYLSGHSNIKCYAIAVENIENQEKIEESVVKLYEAGFDSTLYVAGGTVFGYVYLDDDELECAIVVMESIDGAIINPNPMDNFLARMIRESAWYGVRKLWKGGKF